LTCKDIITPECYKKALIVEGASVFSTIKYYYGPIQCEKAKKPK
jgi:hypothetical protein